VPPEPPNVLGDPASAGQRRRLIAQLREAPGAIAAIARATAALAPPVAATDSAGEWSVRQVVAHLALVEAVVWQARLDQLAGAAPGEPPRWSWTEPGTSDDGVLATLETALAAFAERRAATLARVDALDEAGWRRAGIHATYGRLDVAGLLRVITDHDAEHRASLEAHPG
jgi:hypothetical protein